MSKNRFDAPVKPPEFVKEARSDRLGALVMGIVTGLGVKLTAIILELVAFYYLGGQSILLDAISSVVDLASSLCLLIFVKVASRPPSSNYPFGRGRLEPLGGLQLALLLAFIGVGLFAQQLVQFFLGGPTSHIHESAWIVPVVAALLLEFAYRRMIYVAKKEHSPALLADAFHYRIDALNSLIAALALFIAKWIPDYNSWVDRGGAMLIALSMVYLGIKASRENFHQLIDRRPKGQFFDLVKKAALLVNGVKATEKIHIQMYGPDAHVDIDVEVDPKMTVDKAHRITQLVRVEVQKMWPNVRDVTVHVEPFYPGDHE